MPKFAIKDGIVQPVQEAGERPSELAELLALGPQAEQPTRRRTFLRFHKRQPERRIVENYHLGPVPKDEEPEVGVCKTWVNGQQS